MNPLKKLLAAVCCCKPQTLEIDEEHITRGRLGSALVSLSDTDLTSCTLYYLDHSPPPSAHTSTHSVVVHENGDAQSLSMHSPQIIELPCSPLAIRRAKVPAPLERQVLGAPRKTSDYSPYSEFYDALKHVEVSRIPEDLDRPIELESPASHPEPPTPVSSPSPATPDTPHTQYRNHILACNEEVCELGPFNSSMVTILEHCYSHDATLSLEMYQQLLEVTRNLMSAIHVLRPPEIREREQKAIELSSQLLPPQVVAPVHKEDLKKSAVPSEFAGPYHEFVLSPGGTPSPTSPTLLLNHAAMAQYVENARAAGITFTNGMGPTISFVSDKPSS